MVHLGRVPARVLQNDPPIGFRRQTVTQHEALKLKAQPSFHRERGESTQEPRIHHGIEVADDDATGAPFQARAAALRTPFAAQGYPRREREKTARVELPAECAEMHHAGARADLGAGGATIEQGSGDSGKTKQF